MNRRRFGLTLCGMPFALPGLAESAKPPSSMPWNQPATIARVYLGGPQPHWPRPDLNIDNEIAEIEARLAEVSRKHAHNVRLIGGEVLRTEQDVRPWLDRTGEMDGVLIIPIAQPTPPLAPLVEQLRVPALFFSRPYATHAWSAVSGMRRAGRRIDVVASSSYGDLDPYMRTFYTAHHLKASKVLIGVEGTGHHKQAEAFHAAFGTTFEFVDGRALREAFDKADPVASKKASDEFVRGALRVIEPSQKEIVDGVRFYLGLQQMLREREANACTIDCFGTLGANTLPGYPCIAWSKFNEQGLYGVCEADLDSTMTQLLITSYAGVPGFVSDPVFDISRNEVIHAHCVSATRLKGPNGPASPYIIRNHLETNEGAVVQVLMPSNETITVARFMEPARLCISTAEVTGPVDSDRGCRSQIRTRVPDAAKWLQNFSGGLHRVIFYGDYVRDVERMGRLLGFEVVREA
jgi:hypothetical protein